MIEYIDIRTFFVNILIQIEDVADGMYSSYTTPLQGEPQSNVICFVLALAYYFFFFYSNLLL